METTKIAGLQIIGNCDEFDLSNMYAFTFRQVRNLQTVFTGVVYFNGDMTVSATETEFVSRVNGDTVCTHTVSTTIDSYGLPQGDARTRIIAALATMGYICDAASICGTMDEEAEKR